MSLVIFEPERRRMNIYGYCRISTAKQSIDRQIRNIKAEYPNTRLPISCRKPILAHPFFARNG